MTKKIMTHLNKFYLILSVMVLAAGAMLYFQIRRSQNIDIDPVALPLIDGNFTEIPLTVTERPLGNPGAPLLIVGFFDFNEQIDRDQAQTIVNFVENNPQAVQFYIKNAPQTKLFGGDRALAHRALFCAGEQKKYWEFLDTLTAEQKINPELLTQTATDLALNIPTWQNCLENTATVQTIAADVALFKNLGLKTTPAIFANNKKINLDEDIDLDKLLNKFIEI